MSQPEKVDAVSVVIATRDRPELLRTALAAVHAQTYPGTIETIVVFDQATPDHTLASTTPELPDTDGAGRTVVVCTNVRKPGLAGARNTGIERATAPLVAFCDDDDRWLPDKLRLQVEALNESGADVAVSGIEIHYAGNGAVTRRIPRQGDLSLAELARRRVMEAHPSTVLVRRSALLPLGSGEPSIGLIDEEIPGSYGEDYDWILRAAEAGPIAVVPEALVEVAWGAQSYFQQRWRIIIESIDYGLAKHAVLSADARGHARLLGRKAFSYAALGERATALRWAWRCWRRSPREQRAYIAAIVAIGLISADRALHLAHRRGRGI